jgi:HK97 gp10 family phage protein
MASTDMTVKIDVEVAGLIKQVGLMDTKLRRKILRKAVTNAARPMIKAAKSNLAKLARTGLLSLSIGNKVKVYPRTITAVAIVGARYGFKSKKYTAIKSGLTGKTRRADPIRYAHLVERGTKHSRAFPFLRPAYAATKQDAMRIIKQELWDGIKAELAIKAAT